MSLYEEIPCEVCGKLYWVPVARHANFRRKTCSDECLYKLRSRNTLRRLADERVADDLKS